MGPTENYRYQPKMKFKEGKKSLNYRVLNQIRIRSHVVSTIFHFQVNYSLKVNAIQKYLLSHWYYDVECHRDS